MTVSAQDSQLSFTRRWNSLQAREARLAWMLILPTALIVFGLVVFPAVFSVWISFRDVGLKNLNDVFHAPFTGLENYRRVFNDLKIIAGSLTISPSSSRADKAGGRRSPASSIRSARRS
jgi:ABC-type sugar transport system permease subunit